MRGGTTQQALLEKYFIRGKQCINNWMRKFGEIKSDNNSNSIVNSKRQATKESILELKVKKLEEELKREQFRTKKALETMIDIAQRELKIDIRKKSGAKR